MIFLLHRSEIKNSSRKFSLTQNEHFVKGRFSTVYSEDFFLLGYFITELNMRFKCDKRVQV